MTNKMKVKPKIGDSCITYVLIKLDNNNFRWVSVVCEVVQLSNIIVGKWELEIRHEEKIIRKIYGYKKLPNLIYSVESSKHKTNIIDICSKEEEKDLFDTLIFKCTGNIPLFK